MKVKDIMVASVATVQPTDAIGVVAQLMADKGVGAIPILEDDRLVGIVTDRDIVVRAVATRIGPEQPIAQIMSENVMTCSADIDLSDALGVMSSEQVRRLPVCDHDGRLVGMISLGDIANNDPDKCEVGETLDDICDPSGLHSQPPVFA